MKKIFLAVLSIILLLAPKMDLFAQGRIYDGPDDGAGDPYLEREGFMTGNRVQLLFKNNTELGDYPRKDAVRWPRGIGGNVMHDGVGLVVSAPVFITQGSIPVTDTTQIRLLSEEGLIDTLFYCQTNYREEMDRDETGQIEWGFHPAPGYMNNLSEIPAMSNDPESWPPQGWLYTKRRTHWPGEWDGRFGRGQIRAELEAYVVANDAQDLEYLGDDDMIKYYPRPDIKIGDIDASVTVQKGKPWGGLGIRVKQRGFQWNNPMAQDCIFWEYTIANISDYTLPQMAFGYWLDNDIGGENSGEDGSFYKLENLSYSWDTDGVGEDGYPTGTAGYAYLESPGIFNDGRDNDDDGLIDERRDNEAGIKIGPTDGISDLNKFFIFYGLEESDLAEHWSGDEDQDWSDGLDENNNGIYDSGEYCGDDVGLDGVAPGEENYYGPDEDDTECNHKPDLGEGYAEPNFAWTDVSETDMLGLTTLLFYEAVPHTEPYTNWFSNDKSLWIRMTYTDSLESGAADIANLFQLFSTAIFPLYKGHTEFISISQLHSYDDLAGLVSPEHKAPALLNLKKTVQVIYEKDYRFAQPPKMPTLKAIPGDGYVQLIWDNRSDRITREPFLGNINDFEGYKVYRSTDKDMKDPQVITDGYGTKTFFKPIFQCDLKDGISGFTDFGLLNGMAYNLGEDTGIAYSFRDETVQNGRTYYYAIVAYDYGIRPDQLKGTSVIATDEGYGIAPSENNVVIRKDEFERIEFIGQNVAIVTPGTNAAGETVSSAFNITHNAAGGTVEPEIVDINSVTDHTYKVKFNVTKIDSNYVYHPGYGFRYTAAGLQVYDVTLGDILIFEDALMKGERDALTPKNMHTVLEKYDNDTSDPEDDFWHVTTSQPQYTEIFDGLRLKVQMASRIAEYDYINSGWLTGTSPMNITTIDDNLQYYSWNYNIVFSDQPVYTGQLRRVKAVLRDEFGERIDRDACIYETDFNFRIENLEWADTTGAPALLDMCIWDLNDNDVWDWDTDRILVGAMTTKGRWDEVLFIIDFLNAQEESELPQANDVYAIRFRKPFFTSDSVVFSVNAAKTIDKELAKTEMEKIKVVPNPYVASNVMESSVVNKWLNQGRRLMFTHLPEKCTIKIFTTSGILIRELHAPEDALTSYNSLGKSNNGVLHWDMLTSEGLEIAAGMYFYHVKDDKTGKEKTGKFAVLK
ncbi:hypothetical protein JW935_04970 [candidate division KSB1 bacterium]|nr:hypothetical protein [candidate division KSB1 bacterium]